MHGKPFPDHASVTKEVSAEGAPERDNPLFHRLLQAFERRTGVPVLINTSFNENEPIVNEPAEALNCFLRTDMDVLVLGNHVLEKRTTTESSRTVGEAVGKTAEETSAALAGRA